MTSGYAQPVPHEIRYAGGWFHLLTGDIFPARLALFSGFFPNHGQTGSPADLTAMTSCLPTIRK